MKRTIRFAALYVVGCVAALWGATIFAQEKDGAAAPKAGELVAASVELPAVDREKGGRDSETLLDDKTEAVKYWVFQPSDESAKTDAGFPLMLFLHGAGERGDDLELLKKYGPPKFCSEPESAKNWKFFTVAPQCPAGVRWSTAQLNLLLERVCAEYPVDRDRVYVTGVSMGGFATWSLLARISEKIAAAAPICGWGDPNAAPKMATTPIWAFHGDQDQAVRLASSQIMIDANRKAGNPDAKLTVYEGVGHNSWLNAYAEADLYTWLLSKRLSGKPTKVEPVAADETPKAGELVAASVELPAVKREGGRRGPETLDETSTQTLKYYVFQPLDESAKTDAGFPLMLVLHGSGERGDDLNKLKVYGPAMYCSKAESAKDWKFFTVAPQCPANAWWSAAQLSVMIDKLCEKYPIDKDRVYVTGVSMGGYGTWSLLAQCPEKIAAVAPICGGGAPNDAAKTATTPVWAFHGDQDRAVPLSASQAMIDAHRKAGNPDAKLTVYPGVGHNSWINAYADPELYAWLLSKRLSGKPASVEPVREASVDEAPKAGELTPGAVEVPLSKRERGLFGPETLDETKSQTLRYLAFQPVDESAKTDAGFPLLIFLHGIGERGDDLNKLKIYGPTAICSNPESAKTWKFFTVAPQCFPDSWWSATQLEVLLDKVCEKYPIDKSRVYVTGLSMGGFGTWSLLAQCPEKIAAAVPICGGGDPNAAEKMAATPIWAFHGDKDGLVPPGMSQAMIDANQKAGNPEAKLTIYEGVGHDSWTKAYADPDLYEWLLSKKKPTTE